MQSKEEMAAWAASGIHGVFVEEVFSGADIISPQSYEQFVFAYNQPYFQHMRALGLLPIHYVCGDVIPRLEQMVQYDIAAVAVEESKKGFRIELTEVVERVAGHKAVFGNIDAVRFGIHATAEEMSAEVRRQAGIGAQARGFIASTGSPFPLETDPRMVDALVSTAHSISTQAEPIKVK
jgi:uroporphyrinogen-III decarboxylase